MNVRFNVLEGPPSAPKPHQSARYMTEDSLGATGSTYEAAPVQTLRLHTSKAIQGPYQSWRTSILLLALTLFPSGQKLHWMYSGTCCCRSCASSTARPTLGTPDGGHPGRTSRKKSAFYSAWQSPALSLLEKATRRSWLVYTWTSIYFAGDMT